MLIWILVAILVLVVARTYFEVAFLKRALGAFSEGRPTEALAWVSRAQLLALGGNMNPIAYQVKGLALAARGEIARAEAAYVKSAERARVTGQNQTLGRSLVLLATIDRRKGEVLCAEERAREAAALDPKCRRDALLCLAECELVRGAFDEGRAHLKEAHEAEPIALTRLEEMSRATVSLAEAWLEGEAGDYEAARRAVGEAEARASEHPKLVLFCSATGTWLRAVATDEGEKKEAMREVAALDEALGPFVDDVEVQLCVSSLQARASTEAGAFAEGKRYGERYLSLPLAKCFVPRAKVLLAMCLAGLGDEAGARRALEEAAAFGPELHFARVARERLG